MEIINNKPKIRRLKAFEKVRVFFDLLMQQLAFRVGLKHHSHGLMVGKIILNNNENHAVEILFVAPICTFYF
jgi:hypothetical protein